MKIDSYHRNLAEWLKLLRWNKPSGRLILLIPAGWSLWLTPNPPPSLFLLALITAGGMFISGAGCIANDIWDQKFDKEVKRTQNRPLAKKSIRISTAFSLMLIMLILSLIILILIPIKSRIICFILAFIAITPILIYPSAKRWFKYPQAILAFCWGFAVLIPWAASESSLNGGPPLIFCWASTCLWTFGFDTIYAMSDKDDDIRIGLNSSAISLKDKVIRTVSISYAISSLCFGFAAYFAGIKWFFWIIWFITSLGMQLETWKLNLKEANNKKFSNHFSNQVLINSLLLLGLIISRKI